MGDQACMSYWFPKIAEAGLPVPRTVLLEMPDAAVRDIFRSFDQEAMTGEAKPFFEEIGQAALSIGFPFFLRSGQTSGKHDWSTTCLVCDIPSIETHVMNILYFSLCVGVPDTSVWAVREMLPIRPMGFCLKYAVMPVNREFRYFVDGGEIVCQHPYWPRSALVSGGWQISDTDYERLCAPPPDHVGEIAAQAGAAVGGQWSVDLLETARGWFLTDMAPAHQSFHWEDCAMTFEAHTQNIDQEKAG